VTRPPPFHRNRRRGWLAPVGNFFDRVSYTWWKLRQRVGRIFNPRWLAHLLVQFGHRFMDGCRYPFYILGWLLKQAVGMFRAWWQIRNFRYLIQGLPALAGIIFIIVIAVYTVLRSEDGLQDLYARQAINSRFAADKRKEQLCYERLMQVQGVGDPRRLETQYALARVSRELGQEQRARFLLQELANPDVEGGLPAAHIERAREIWARSRRPQDIELAERHLRRALNKQPENQEANALMGLILYNTPASSGASRFDEAIPYLMKSNINDVWARLSLASIYKMRGDDQRAELYARPVLDFLLKRTENNIDDINYHLVLADAYVQIEEYEKAIDTLRKAYSFKKSDLYRSQLSNVYVAWYKRLARMPANALRERQMLDLLLSALEWDQRNVEALALFVYFMKPGGPNGPEREDAHKTLLALRGNNPYLHLWLGQKLLDQGKYDEAAKEWDLAYKLYPDSPIIANNFAWILTHGRRVVSAADPSREQVLLPPDLSRALAIINQVIERTPKEYPHRYQFHGTRGTIYLKMGMLDKAREDLVLASQGPRAANDQILQRQLIDLYDRLGLKEMANIHRKRLEEIFRRNSRDPQQATTTAN